MNEVTREAIQDLVDFSRKLHMLSMVTRLEIDLPPSELRIWDDILVDDKKKKAILNIEEL